MKSDGLEDVQRILVYKRTHNGDPNEAGEFGCNNCMGTVRNWDFDAVIGVGGLSSSRYRMVGKITWIGIQPLETEQQPMTQIARREQPHSERMVSVTDKKHARIVTFKHFRAFRECGYFPPSKPSAPMFTAEPEAPFLEEYAPTLAGRLLRNVRAPRMLDQHDVVEFAEAMSILALAAASPPSPSVGGLGGRPNRTRCAPARGKSAR